MSGSKQKLHKKFKKKIRLPSKSYCYFWLAKLEKNHQNYTKLRTTERNLHIVDNSLLQVTHYILTNLNVPGAGRGT